MKRIILIIAVLLLLSMACSVASTPPASAPEVSGEDQIATIVAATMGASGGVAATELPTEIVTAPQPNETVNKPRGTRVAYVRDGNIWLWEEGVGGRQLTDTGMMSQVKISDDGEMIAFTQQRELWAIPADGGEAVQLANQAYLASIPRGGDYIGTPHLDTYEFIPETHILFFDVFLDTDSYAFPYGGLHRVDADAPSPAQVLLDGQSGNRYYSPDNAWVAFAQPDQIAVMRVDGSAYRVAFEFAPTLTYSEWSFYPEVVWKGASDGFYLALPPADFLGKPDELGYFWYIGLDGKIAQLATFRSGPVWDAVPQVSPDGTKVLYLMEVGEGREIRIVDASTADTGFIAASDDAIGILGWGDGDHFGFWYGDANKPWYASVSEHSQRDLTDVYPTLGYSIRWLGDGRLIFEGGGELWITEPSGQSAVISASVDYLDFDVAE